MCHTALQRIRNGSMDILAWYCYNKRTVTKGKGMIPKMKIGRLKKNLEENGFQEVRANQSNLFLYCKTVRIPIPGVCPAAEQKIAYTVFVWDLTTGESMEAEAYRAMLDHARKNFLNQGYTEVEILSLLCTWEPQNWKEFCLDYDQHWIVNLVNGQLIIFENQSSCFHGVEEMVKNAAKPVSLKTLPVITILLVGINIFVFLVTELTGGSLDTEHMIRMGAMYWYNIAVDKEYYRFLTSMFLHFGIRHLVDNMFVLVCIGSLLEKNLGKIKYTILYLASGILAGVISLEYHTFRYETAVSAGASGAIFGVIGGIAYIILINRGRVRNLSPRSMILFLLLSFYNGYADTNVDVAAHVGGFIAGILLCILLYHKKDPLIGKAEWHGNED